jgi:hypothetical protein
VFGASNLTTTEFFTGNIQTYNASSGSLVVNINFIQGSGTYSDWSVNLTGVPGNQGPVGTGSKGDPGTNGTNGDKYATTYNSYINLGGFTHTPLNATFDIASNLSYTTGQSVLFGKPGYADTYFIGRVVSYTATSGELKLIINTVVGTNSSSTWDVNLDGAPGKQGEPGDKYMVVYNQPIDLGSLSLIDTPSYTIGTGFAYTTGQNVIFGATGDSADFFVGGVISYIGGVLKLQLQRINGNSSYSAWEVNLEGAPGPKGDKGDADKYADVYKERYGINLVSLSTSFVSDPGKKYSYTISKNLSYTTGQDVIFGVYGDSSDFFTGQVSSYTKDTGVLTLSLLSVSGTGAHTTWEVNIGGAPGRKGDAGDIYAFAYSGQINLSDLNLSSTVTVPYTLSNDLSYTPGQDVVFGDFNNSGEYFEGTVHSYSKTTGVLNVYITTITGTGSSDTWYVNIGGAPGQKGDKGDADKYADIYENTTTEINLTTMTTSLSVAPSEIYSYQLSKNLSYTTGQDVIFGAYGDSADFFTGQVSSYTKDTGVIKLYLLSVTGSGTYPKWEVNIGGAPGRKGDTGEAGDKYAFAYSGNINLSVLGISSTVTVPYTISTNLSYTPGQDVIFGDFNDSGEYFEGTVHSYSKTTGVLNVYITTITGTGSSDTWYVNIGGAPGKKGDKGDADKYVSTYLSPINLSNLGQQTFPYTQTYTIDKNLAYTSGQEVVFGVNDELSSERFIGIVSQYNKSTGLLSIDITEVTGTANSSSWDINLVGAPGQKGKDGDTYTGNYIANPSIDLSTITLPDTNTHKFTIPLGLSYTTGQDIIFGATGETVSDNFGGTVVSYDKTTGDLNMIILSKSGSNSYTNWEVNVGGAPGKKGDKGEKGVADTYTGIYTSPSPIDVSTIILSDAFEHTYIIPLGLSYTTGQDIIFGATGVSVSDNFGGYVVSYDNTNGVLKMHIQSKSGTGQHTNWEVNVGGAPGKQGNKGDAGDTYAAEYDSQVSIDLSTMNISNITEHVYKIPSGLSYTTGQDVIFGAIGVSNSDYFGGTVISYDKTTGNLNMYIQSVSGSSSNLKWEVNVGGASGKKGDPGTSADHYKTTCGDAIDISTDFTTLPVEKTYTIGKGLAYTTGQEVIFGVYTNASLHFVGTVMSYTSGSTSGTLRLNVQSVIGNGQSSLWNVNVGGVIGQTGDTGSKGDAGADGDRYKSLSSDYITLSTIQAQIASATYPPFTIQPGMSYTTGMDVLFGVIGDSSDYFIGIVHSYDTTTGVMKMSKITIVSGTQQYNNWEVNVNGSPGKKGDVGNQGDTGDTGVTGDIYKGLYQPTSALSLTALSQNTLPYRQTYTITNNLSYSTGQEVIFGISGDASDYFEGTVVSYDNISGVLKMDIRQIIGIGESALWEVNLKGAPGKKGEKGDAGNNGDQYASTYIGLIDLLTLTTSDTPIYKIGKNLAYTSGQEVVFGADGDISDHFTGKIVYYAKDSGEIKLNLQSIVGTGAPTIWDVNVVGAPGKQGDQGVPGNDGDRYAYVYTGYINLGTLTTTDRNTYIIDKNLAYTTGQEVIIGSSGVVLEYFTGTVFSYVKSTGSLTLDIKLVSGSNEYTTWDVNITGAPGKKGEPGKDGDRYAYVYKGDIHLAEMSTTDTPSYVVGTGLSYTTGQDVIFGVKGDPGEYFTGKIVLYDANTGDMKVNITSVAGRGHYTSWEVNISGSPGNPGTDIIAVNINADGYFIFLRSDDAIITTATSIYSLFSPGAAVPTGNINGSSTNYTSITQKQRSALFANSGNSTR